MLQKIRKLYGQDDAEAFVGEVECDEVYIGGKEKWNLSVTSEPSVLPWLEDFLHQLGQMQYADYLQCSNMGYNALH